MENSIHYSETIFNILKEKNLHKVFSGIVIKHIISILIAIFTVGYRGKTVDFAKESNHHRTTIAYFLNHGKWNDDMLEHIIRQSVIDKIYTEAKNTGKPILCIIDDTIASKSKPSSKAQHPIEDAYFHFSHLKKKQDYGHQAISIMLSCNNITLNYAIIMYDKSVSKIDLVCKIAAQLPIPPVISYLLCDSWYACSKVVDSFIMRGFYTIGALKTNRTIYPSGVKTNIARLAETIGETNFHIVTVKGRKYHIFRYEGNLNGILNTAVLISYPVGAFHKAAALRAFICTNVALSTEEILALYVKRWEIEVFFRNSKTKLAMDKYQIIKRNQKILVDLFACLFYCLF